MCTKEKIKRLSAAMAAAIACFAVALPQAMAEEWQEKAKLLASDGAADDRLGYSVYISGDYAIVGAYDANESDSGSAYIFKRDGTSWSQQAKLTASDGAADNRFGWSVSISGDYAIVGAIWDDDNGSDSGSAYIFKRDVVSWSQQAKLTALDGAATDYFGYSVSISGDYAIVGALYDDDNGSASGSAYVFKRDGVSWSQQAKLTASDGAVGDNFGYSVSIDGDLAILGACWDDDNGTASGSAYVFKRDGVSWSQQAKLTASDGANGDNFGWSVSISGNLAIVGAYCTDDNGSNSGSAYIFRWNGTSWIQRTELLASDGTLGGHFGWSVSISGDYAIIGAHSDDDSGSDSGSAYIFKRDGVVWSEQQKLLASDGAAYDYFGNSVSISGHNAIVGAYWDDDNGSNSGSAYAFMYCPSADLSGDCKVDFVDFALFGDWWLYGTN
jgi:hypothetical protein